MDEPFAPRHRTGHPVPLAREDLRLTRPSAGWARAAALAVSLAWATAGCNEKAIESWLSEGQPSPTGPSLYSEEPLRQALTQMKKKLPGPLQILSFLAYADHLVIQVMDPIHHAKALQYVYRGGALSDGVPVRLLGKGKLDDNVFPIEAVKLASIPKLVREAKTKANMPEGTVARVLLKRNLPESMDIQFRVFVTSQRRDAFFDANQDGVLLE